MVVHPQWHIVGYANRSYFPEKGINFVAPNARFIYRETGHYADIFPAYDFKSPIINFIRNLISTVVSLFIVKCDNNLVWSLTFDTVVNESKKSSICFNVTVLLFVK